MKHPIFHVDEIVRIGAHPYNKHLRGLECRIARYAPSVNGMNRYIVEFADGVCEIFLESTLSKRWELSDWGMLRGIWQPRRAER